MPYFARWSRLLFFSASIALVHGQYKFVQICSCGADGYFNIGNTFIKVKRFCVETYVHMLTKSIGWLLLMPGCQFHRRRSLAHGHNNI
eukprot:scaffold3150_cov51-Attheya_sp.AAC.9